MLIDMEGHAVILTGADNSHEKIIGKSGSGKTYASCRRIEELCNDMLVIIVDFSGSYTERELERNHFNAKGASVISLNPKKNCVTIAGGESFWDTVENVTDSAISVLGITSMMQRKLLAEAVQTVLTVQGYFSFNHIFNALMDLEGKCEDSEWKKNIDYLLGRVYRIRNIDKIQIVNAEFRYVPGVFIVQLSDFTSHVRVELAQFFLEILWRTLAKGERRVQIIIDEFQMLRLSGTAVEEMLREGRKRGIGVTLLSQFPPAREEVDILEQAATSMYFLPNERNIVSVAKMIAPMDYRKWIPLLKNLERGSCVLVGNYSFPDSSTVHNTPLICMVAGNEKNREEHDLCQD